MNIARIIFPDYLYNLYNYCNCFSDVQARPERLISRLRTVSLDDTGPRLIAIRQPKGPEASSGFSVEVRTTRLPGCVPE